MINHFGLDIGSEVIKIAQVAKEDNSYKLLAAGMAQAPINGTTSDSDKDLLAIAETIKKLKNESKISTNEVMVSIPERWSYTQVVDFPKMSEDELSQAVPWEAENVIPKPLSEVSFDWEIIEDEKTFKNNKMKVLITASPTELINKYLQILKLAELIPISLETELLSISRCLKKVYSKGTLFLGNLGSESTDIAILRNGNILSTHSIPSAGKAITRSISTGLGLDLSVSEEYKKSYGLSSEAEGKISGAIEPILAIILNEFKKTISFYEDNEHESISLAILTGGTCLLPGVSEYFTKGLGVEVQTANPFSMIGVEQTVHPELIKNAPLFSVCLGLAIKEV